MHRSSTPSGPLPKKGEVEKEVIATNIGGRIEGEEEEKKCEDLRGRGGAGRRDSRRGRRR